MNIEGAGAITQRDLVINALRMRPDRIVIGECRGAEALDMLQAMNTGHDGSMTTCHANSGVDAFSRLETMVMMGTANVPDKVVRQMLASAIHIIIHMNRLTDGSRKIMSIAEVRGVQRDHVVLEDIFRFERAGIGSGGRALGTFRATGSVPLVSERLKAYGVNLSKSIFQELVEIGDS
jgi:pilus assembly protein CpaF